ncbi:NAD(P)-dependent dehydrogenase (short-subunit alcohol dehydrogenase family) [Rathayibacter sp. PhB152]|uniref:SDR family NAD(P)-dependent oxidoreductase n=1 Tax=Rathayibacter sp. PhB152 TaxID=2485190 RepID=UPI000F4BD549|nr:SDR family NAD(P)-dependent oxidoreductase [Rathayibacter sp. PhB152]ROQ64395.1 NAD(P)-dependent dehydrogenase (short-subunit alcohol dehydrogenase family) [Rathayibacter sp. PhB152]
MTTTPTPPSGSTRTALLVGASRGLGHALAAEFLDRGWDVIGTVRDPGRRTPLHQLQDEVGADRLAIERLDITDEEETRALRERLAGRVLDLLFVNAGTTTSEDTPIGQVSTEDFVEVFVTNALSPMRVIETLQDLVADDGLIGAMSSGQGSIANNTGGGREVYRGSKAALNQFLKSFAVRQSGTGRAIVLIAPGWIRTALGGDDAPFTIEENVPKVVDVLVGRLGTPGIAYRDFRGEVVPW